MGPLAHPAAEGGVQPQPIAHSGEGAPEAVTSEVPLRAPSPQILSGTGAFVQPVPGSGGAASGASGDITLNFVDADVREVLPRVLGDILHLNYTIDPKI